jgi:hypothetical protein
MKRKAFENAADGTTMMCGVVVCLGFYNWANGFSATPIDVTDKASRKKVAAHQYQKTSSICDR